MGNLTRDPEIRYTPKGTAVTDIGLAVSRKYKLDTGEEREEVCFVTIEVWGRQAETAGQYLTKGSPAFVEGELKYDSWTNKEGKKESRLKVRADRIQFLGRPRNAEFGEAGGTGGGSEKPARPASKPAASAPQNDSGPDEVPIEEDDIPF